MFSRHIGHRTPRYILNRIWTLGRRITAPHDPWLTSEAVHFLEKFLRPSDIGVEFGSGRSSVWLAKRTRRLVSVEHSREWHERVKGLIQNAQLRNVRLMFIPADDKRPVDPLRSAYVHFWKKAWLPRLDYVLIDGLYRDQCAIAIADRLARGGVLIVDNANWFIPHASFAPNTAARVASAAWARLLKKLKPWRPVWTSDGVTDTALWIKP